MGRPPGILLAIAIAIGSLADANAKPLPIKIVMEKRGGEAVAFINGRRITSRPYYGDLATVYRRVGRSYPVWVLVDERMPISELSNIVGELQAVGYLNVTLFIFDRDTRRMKFIDWRHATVPIPFELPK